jgi:hypothetical protein
MRAWVPKDATKSFSKSWTDSRATWLERDVCEVIFISVTELMLSFQVSAGRETESKDLRVNISEWEANRNDGGSTYVAEGYIASYKAKLSESEQMLSKDRDPI